VADFRRYHVWQSAHQLTLAVYEATVTFPDTERYGLSSQLRRSAASSPANLAEGLGRNTDGDRSRFASIAIGSACEVEYHLLLSRDLGYIDTDTHGRLLAELISVRKMLSGLLRRLNSNK
jgi:four helix bundle protein